MATDMDAALTEELRDRGALKPPSKGVRPPQEDRRRWFQVWPDEDDSGCVVDIIIIHGLQGHPLSTWLYKRPSVPPPQSSPSSKGRRKLWDKMTCRDKNKSPQTDKESAAQSGTEETKHPSTGAYWPAELLPAECPKARIIAWGYDTIITRGPGASANKNGIFAHARDLLYSLGREREHRRPIIFVAHSLGGILVKDMLSQADTSREAEYTNIIEDTSAVVFLGTPHRGSGHANMGDIARRIVSALLIDTNPAILDALNLRNDDLERSQQSFARMWGESTFVVKTFQESRGIAGTRVGKLSDKVVPNESSSLGHPSEHAETLDADHLSMTKYQGSDDPNWCIFGKEVKKLYLRAVQVVGAQGYQRQSRSLNMPSASSPPSDKAKMEARAWLIPRNMGSRERTIGFPANGACEWPMKHRVYLDWLERKGLSEHHGLLSLIGCPGSGKSVLVKTMATLCSTQVRCPEERIISFFFNSRGHCDENSLEGFMQAILYQILPLSSITFDSYTRIYETKALHAQQRAETIMWTTGELRHILTAFFNEPRRIPIYMFVDAVDECGNLSSDDGGPRSVVRFLRDLADTAFAAQSNLNICMSSRRYPTIDSGDCLVIAVDSHNNGDVANYVRQEFGRLRSVPRSKSSIQNDLVEEICRRAGEVFLWARLMLDLISEAFDRGLGINAAQNLLHSVPSQLKQLFERILDSLEESDRILSKRLFQWILLAQRPLTGPEWFHALALILIPDLESLREWEESPQCINDVEQLAKVVRGLTGGLVEVKLPAALEGNSQCDLDLSTGPVRVGAGSDRSKFSMKATAGSMEPSGPEGVLVQFIHETVREYILTDGGLTRLGEESVAGHAYISSMCLHYASLEEMALSGTSSGYASISSQSSPAVRSFNVRFSGANVPGELTKSPYNESGQNLSIASFGSSAANSQRRSLSVGSMASRSSTRGVNNRELLTPSDVSAQIDEDDFDDVAGFIAMIDRNRYTHVAHITHKRDSRQRVINLNIWRSMLEPINELADQMSSSNSAQGHYVYEPCFPVQQKVKELSADLPLNIAGDFEQSSNAYKFKASTMRAIPDLDSLHGDPPALPLDHALATEAYDLATSRESDPGVTKASAAGERCNFVDHDAAEVRSEVEFDQLTGGQDFEACIPDQAAAHEESLAAIRKQSPRKQPAELSALRLYVVEMFTHHAVAADLTLEDPDPILSRVRYRQAWGNWCRLNGGILPGTTPLYFAAQWNLSTWVDWYIEHQPLRWMEQLGGDPGFPLLAATSNGNRMLVEKLIPWIRTTTHDSDGWSVTDHLISCDHPSWEETLSLLCEYQAEQGQYGNVVWGGLQYKQFPCTTPRRVLDAYLINFAEILLSTPRALLPLRKYVAVEIAQEEVGSTTRPGGNLYAVAVSTQWLQRFRRRHGLPASHSQMLESLVSDILRHCGVGSQN